MTFEIERTSLPAFDFEGLEIGDFTAGRDCSSSIAEITVPAGARHPRARSRRSDKYYYVVEGRLVFRVRDEVLDLATGDVCVVPRETPFSYENESGAVARVLLVHTPPFALEDEVFE